MATIKCICPAKPDGAVRHPDGDTVTVRAALDFQGAVAVRNVIALMAGETGVAEADILAALSETYLYHGIESWTLVDDRGKDIPVNRANIHDLLLSHPFEAMTVSDEADGMYQEAVVLPLVNRAAASSPSTPTDDSTSVTTDSSLPPPTPSSPSSISTTPTADTDKTSRPLVGVYSSSPS
jgi:hypothetical protein